MTMTFPQAVLTIVMVVLGTVITRFLPFLLFPASPLKDMKSIWVKVILRKILKQLPLKPM